MRVVFKSTGQGFPIFVPVLRDYADGLSVRQKPLPQIGTWGVVMFPYGDVRNGIWMGSYYPSQVDALTTTQASGTAATDPFIDYEAHFSGYWRLLDGLGNEAVQWPDGSYFTAGASSGLPTVYRHTVVANKQQNVSYALGTRIPAPPSGFPFTFVHESGTQVAVDASGNVYASGNVSGATLTFNFGAASFTMTSGGNVNINVPGSDTFNVSQSGMSVTDALVLVSKLLAKYNAHTHPVTGVQTGGSTVTSSPPTTALVAADIQSAVAKVSN